MSKVTQPAKGRVGNWVQASLCSHAVSQTGRFLVALRLVLGDLLDSAKSLLWSWDLTSSAQN